VHSNIEKNLIEKVVLGDEDAFSEIYRLNRDRVYGFVYRMTLDRAIAEDLTHEVFVCLMEHPERFDAKRASLSTFLCAIARNLVMNQLRRKFNGDVGFDEFENSEIWEDKKTKNPLTDLLNRELSEQIEIYIAMLPPLQREAIILREFQGLSYKEISQITEAELSTVKTRLRRARQILAEQLSRYVKSPEGKCYELY
jgi:RNA polymerase sigma-70 factor, ECF subfamily